jgi:hypothetical protein
LVSGDGKISTRIEGLGADANTIVEKFGKD